MLFVFYAGALRRTGAATRVFVAESQEACPLQVKLRISSLKLASALLCMSQRSGS